MPTTRVAITPVTQNKSWDTTLDEITFTAVDVALGNYCVFTGKEFLIVYNSGAIDAHTITVTSVASGITGRTGNVSQSIAAGKYYITQIFPCEGWQQSDTYLYFSGDHAELKVAVIKTQ